jgi:hypothetical protein
VELRVLGRHGHTVSIDGAPPHGLSLRQAEALVLLALYPDGLSAEQLTLHLYGDAGKPVTTRALMSRLRSLLAGCLRARPYRLAADVHADVLEVFALLEAGEPARALARYRGPLLLESEVVRIAELRDELAAARRWPARPTSCGRGWAPSTAETTPLRWRHSSRPRRPTTPGETPSPRACADCGTAGTTTHSDRRRRPDQRQGDRHAAGGARGRGSLSGALRWRRRSVVVCDRVESA